jgi:hypothetical protein
LGEAVLVVRVAGGKDVVHGWGGAVVQIGGGAPGFDQGWGVEFVRWIVEGPAGGYVVRALRRPKSSEEITGSDQAL